MRCWPLGVEETSWKRLFADSCFVASDVTTAFKPALFCLPRSWETTSNLLRCERKYRLIRWRRVQEGLKIRRGAQLLHQTIGEFHSRVEIVDFIALVTAMHSEIAQVVPATA